MKQTGYKNLKQKGHLNKLNNKQHEKHEKQIKNEVKLKQKRYNKNNILITSQRRSPEFENVLFDGYVNENTVTLSKREEKEGK